MNIPDLKSEAHKNIDGVNGNALAVIQIIADDNGHVSACIGGIPDVMVKVLGHIMMDNHQIKDLFEAAWMNSGNISSSMN